MNVAGQFALGTSTYQWGGHYLRGNDGHRWYAGTETLFESGTLLTLITRFRLEEQTPEDVLISTMYDSKPGKQARYKFD
jgi:hypothetical protein